MAIVVGLDGSAESLQALRWSLDEARHRQTTVLAVYVWQFPVAASWASPYLIAGPSELPEIDADELRRQAKARLAGFVAQVDPAGVQVEQKVVEGHPAEELSIVAKDAELLVVGSRGHGGFSGLLLGSVSQACLHHAHCPVVIVRSGLS